MTTTKSYKEYKSGTWVAFTKFIPPAPPKFLSDSEDAEEDDRSWLEEEQERYNPFAGMPMSSSVAFQYPIQAYARDHQLDGQPFIVAVQSGQFLGMIDYVTGLAFSVNLELYELRILDRKYVEWFIAMVNLPSGKMPTSALPERYYFSDDTCPAANVNWNSELKNRQFEKACRHWQQQQQQKDRQNGPSDSQRPDNGESD